MASFKDIARAVLYFVTTPLPGVDRIPGLDVLLGGKQKREIEKDAGKRLSESELILDKQLIALDRTLMERADRRHEYDTEIQKLIFGFPITTPEDVAAIPDTEKPLAQAFLDLEDYKSIVRSHLRPAHEKAIARVEAEMDNVDQQGHITREYKSAHKDLEKIRLKVLDQRVRLMQQREATYEMVEQFMSQVGVEPDMPLPSITAQEQEARKLDITVQSMYEISQIDRLRQDNERDSDEIKARTTRDAQKVERFHHQEEAARARIEESRDMLWKMAEERVRDGSASAGLRDIYKARHQAEKDDAVKLNAEREIIKGLRDNKEEIQHEIEARRDKHRMFTMRRAGVGVALAVAGTVGVLGVREMGALERRFAPYAQRETQYKRDVLEGNHPQEKQFTYKIDNPFDDRRLAVQGHHIEEPATKDRGHWLVAARLFDLSARAAAGTDDVKVHYAEIALHEMTSRSASLPFWQQSLFVDSRSAAVEEMLLSTTSHNVISNSVVSNTTFSPGSRGERNERNFLFGITCPLLFACGNEGSSGEAGDAQYASMIAHVPRYSVQIGWATGNVHKSDKGLITSDGNHPYPFLVGFIPAGAHDVNMETGKEFLLKDGGSSFATPGVAGNLMVQRRDYAALSWDNIYYANALAADRRMPDYEARAHQKGSDLTLFKTAGFVAVEPERVEQVLMNMLYEKTRRPDIADRPTVIYAAADEMGEARKHHEFSLPAEKDIFKVTFEIVAPPNSPEGHVTLTDASGNKTKLTLIPNQEVTRFTWYGDMGAPGGKYTLDADRDVRIGMVAHVNERDAITMGLRELGQLKSRDELMKLVDKGAVQALPQGELKTPELLHYKDLALNNVTITRATGERGR